MTFADLTDILRREIGADLAARACAALCREAAGESVYVPRRMPGRPEIRSDDTSHALQVRYGVAPRTARRWVTRWKG